MEIYVTIEERKKITLDKQTKIDVAIQTICDVFDIPKQHQINDDGELLEWWETGGGSHSWFEDEKVRDATEDDKLAVEMINKLEKARITKE